MAETIINGMIYRVATTGKTVEHADTIAARHINNGADAQVIKRGTGYAVCLGTGLSAPVRIPREPKKPATPRRTTSNAETHAEAVKLVSEYLGRHGINVNPIFATGMDMVLDDGRSVLVRGMYGEANIALMNGTLDTLRADVVIAVTNMGGDRAQYYIMDMTTATDECVDNPYKDSGRSNFFIRPDTYTAYRDNLSVVA